MNKFINLQDGRVNVASYRLPDCQVTALTDLISRAVEGSDDYLTASFGADELCKHPAACEFLERYGVKWGSRVALADEAFAVQGNTVVVDIA